MTLLKKLKKNLELKGGEKTIVKCDTCGRTYPAKTVIPNCTFCKLGKLRKVAERGTTYIKNVEEYKRTYGDKPKENLQK